MEAEQKAKLTPIERSEDFEYEIGLLFGIKRIVLLIERHIERITESGQYVIELSDDELKIVSKQELAETEREKKEKRKTTLKAIVKI